MDNTFTRNFLPILAGVVLLVIIAFNAAQAPVPTPVSSAEPTALPTPVEVTAPPATEIPSPSFIVTPAPSTEVTPEPSTEITPSAMPTMPATDTDGS